MPNFLMEVWGSELRSSGLRGSTLTSGPPPSPLMLPSVPPISLIVIGEPGLLDPWGWALHLKIYSNIVASQISVFYVGKGILPGEILQAHTSVRLVLRPRVSRHFAPSTVSQAEMFRSVSISHICVVSKVHWLLFIVCMCGGVCV